MINTIEIQNKIVKADRMFVNGQTKEAEIIINGVYIEIDSAPGNRGAWNIITPITYKILESYGYINNDTPIHEDWE